ncbi:MAG: FAD:protein FMN transferase [Ignavibacteria bacterium]
MKYRYFQSSFILLILFFAGYSYSQDDNPLFEFQVRKNLMGTEFDITALHTSLDTCKRALLKAMKEVDRIESFTSNYKSGTEISNVNDSAYHHPVKISEELFDLLTRSIAYSEKYDGIFDITVGPITEYFGINSEHPLETKPDSKKIDSLLKLTGYKFIQLNRNDLTVKFLKDGMKLDLGGIAKGYALDRAAEKLKSMGLTNFLISGGGDIIVSGLNSQREKWVVGIKNPRDESKLSEKIVLTDLCVATSGDYERYKIIDGIRYHHIINPKTGYPPTNTQSSTVVYKSAEEGVVLSKVLFILGADKISAENDISTPYYIIDSNGNPHFNKSFTFFSTINK